VISEDELNILLNECENLHVHGRSEAAVGILIRLIKYLRDSRVKTSPSTGNIKISNVFVEKIGDERKLRVEYEE